VLPDAIRVNDGVGEVRNKQRIAVVGLVRAAGEHAV
jgi:hypothetical protein